jgi:hypothetical protein
MAEEIKIEPHSNRASFSESWQWLEDGTAVDLTGATIVFCVRDKEGSAVIDASTDDGKITISTTTFTVLIGKSEFSSLDPKDYSVGCTIELDDFTDQLFVGTWTIYDGVVP